MTQSPGLRHFPSSEFLDHPSQAKIGVTPFPDRLHVVTMLSNPLRWRNRYANFWRFEKAVRDAGAILHVVEVAFGDRPFEITDSDDPLHLQLRTDDEIWHKENALNLAIQRLMPDVKYVAWIDADITFVRPDWAQETLQLLQHYDFIQMFSTAQDLDADNDPEPGQLHTGFMYQYYKTMTDPLSTTQMPLDPSGYSGDVPGNGAYWHPGYAWAARVESLEKVGMLIDWAILGSADWHMAWALIGRAWEHLVPQLNRNYLDWCLEWEARAEQQVKRNVGYMPGLILHAFHGHKAKRRYGDRWTFLIKCGFDPAKDIKRDRQGLWMLSGNNPRLRDGIRAYNRMRDEDER